MFGIDGLDLGNVQGGISQFFNMIQIIVAFLCCGGLGYYFHLMLQFKHKVRVREVINGRKIIVDHRAREFTDRDGIRWWQLRKKGIRIVEPPSQAIEIDSKGRKCGEVYKTTSGEYVWATDTATVKDIPQEIQDIKNKDERDKKVEKWRKENGVIAAFEPYTSKQRQILVSQHRKALDKKKKSWQEYILPVAGIASLTILVVSLMIFWGDIAKPVLEMADKQKAYAQVQTEQLRIIQDINNKVQTIHDQEVTGGAGAEPPN